MRAPATLALVALLSATAVLADAPRYPVKPIAAPRPEWMKKGLPLPGGDTSVPRSPASMLIADWRGGFIASPDYKSLAFAGPAEARDGELKTGDVVLSVPVRHAITGELTGDVVPVVDVLAGEAPKRGTAVYAVPITGVGFVWCAPELNVCFPKGLVWTRMHRASGPFVTRIEAFDSGHGWRLPPIAPKPLDFGAGLNLVWRVSGVGRKGASLEVTVETAEGFKGRLDHVGASPGPDGAAVFDLLGGSLRVEPVPGAKGLARAAWSRPPVAVPGAETPY